MSTEKLSPEQVMAEGLEGWTVVPGTLRTRIVTDGYAKGLAVVAAIGAAAEEMDHHPDLDLRWPYVDVALSSHDVGGLTERDVALARTIGTIAAEHDVRCDAAAVTLVELGMDTPDDEEILPFWAAVMGVEPRNGEVWGDGLPTIWFQGSDAAEPRQHWHPDVWIDPAQVQDRIDAAVAAGGTLVTDEHAPSFWVLADPQGNQVCFCTWQDRA